jgi:uncharacterized protein
MALSNSIHFEAVWSYVVEHSPVSPQSIHGINHWKRVERNALYLARGTNIKDDVLRLFAIFHDSHRHNDDIDPGHGHRGAEFAKELRDQLFVIDDLGFGQLIEACSWHTDRIFHQDQTIAICWDADRLDLGRVGITPAPNFLNTTKAKEIAISKRFQQLEA